LVAELDVQRNVTLWLEMEWKHCLSPSANSTRYWPAARANLSFAVLLAFAPRFRAESLCKSTSGRKASATELTWAGEQK
jgi:hypothetical protein